jgi:hypothetical protein
MATHNLRSATSGAKRTILKLVVKRLLLYFKRTGCRADNL